MRAVRGMSAVHVYVVCVCVAFVACICELYPFDCELVDGKLGTEAAHDLRVVVAAVDAAAATVDAEDAEAAEAVARDLTVAVAVAVAAVVAISSVGVGAVAAVVAAVVVVAVAVAVVAVSLVRAEEADRRNSLRKAHSTHGAFSFLWHCSERGLSGNVL
jgi:hypothetical protein